MTDYIFKSHFILAHIIIFGILDSAEIHHDIYLLSKHIRTGTCPTRRQTSSLHACAKARRTNILLASL